MIATHEVSSGLQDIQGRRHLAQALREYAAALESPMWHYHSGQVAIDYHEHTNVFRLSGEISIGRMPKADDGVIDAEFTEVRETPVLESTSYELRRPALPHVRRPDDR